MTFLESGVALRKDRAVRLPQGRSCATYGEDRHCRADGCATLLSRYNPDAVCSAHGGWRSPALDGGRAKAATDAPVPT